MQVASPAAVQADRLAEVLGRTLAKGPHQDIENGLCAMEAVSYIAGEPWSDAPQCACPAITAFMVSWNDSLADEPRNRLLKPLIPLLVGTRSTSAVEERRSYMALDWLIRVFTPKWLDMVPALHEHARVLRGLEAIADMDSAVAAGVKVRNARYAARAVGRGATDARASAGDAARAAARVSAAARAAAGARAMEAAAAAAGDAAGAALLPTTELLQASAVDLVRRMIAVAA